MTDLQTTTVNDGGMGAMLARQMMKYGQTMEDGALGIIKCMVDVDAKSGEFYGKNWNACAEGPVIKFGLEKFYNNRKTKDLLWTKSCEAIGEDFVV